MKNTYKIALSMVLVMLLWMLSGVFKDSNTDKGLQNGAEQVTATERELTKVRVRRIQAEQQFTEVTLRGRTEAKRVVDIKAETSGRLVKLLASKGQHAQAGDILCELADNGRHAQLAQAQAAYEKARIDYDGALRLKQSRLLSDTQIAASKAALETARAALTLAGLEVEHLQIRAPFDGVVEDHPFQVGALMERGDTCARMMDEKTMLVSAQASEKEVLRLSLDILVKARLLSGEELPGKISFLARVADPQTRTYRVEATLDVGNEVLRDGITATLTIPLDAVSAHRISPAVLALDDNGKVGVRTVNSQQQVEFHYVGIVRETTNGIWVTGLPPTVDLITVGQEYVANGDKVQAVREDTDAVHP